MFFKLNLFIKNMKIKNLRFYSFGAINTANIYLPQNLKIDDHLKIKLRENSLVNIEEEENFFKNDEKNTEILSFFYS